MIGNDFDTPIMYQDLANSTMAPMSMMNGSALGTTGVNPYQNTSYLGGVKMKGQAESDKFELFKQKDDESKRTFNKFLKGAGIFAAIITSTILFKSVKKAGGIVQYIKNGWNKLTGKAPKKQSLWKRIKSKFSRKNNPANNQQKTGLWTKIKKFFSRKKP